MTTAYYSQRPQLRRNSPLSVFHPSQGFSADAPMLQRIDVGDSSDDDVPQPMKFSALTRALLESEPPAHVSPANQEHAYPQDNPRKPSAQHARAALEAVDTPSRAPLLKIVRRPSPMDKPGNERGASPPRVVHVARGASSGQRTTSASRPASHTSRSREGTPVHEYVTPAPAPRALRISRNRSGSNASLGNASEGSAGRPGSSNGHRSASRLEDSNPDHSLLGRSTTAQGQDFTRYAPSTLARSRNTSGESAAPPGSMRVKRAAVGTGSFLRGAPVRRGFRRRDSDENPSPNEDFNTSHDQHQEASQSHSRSGSTNGLQRAEEHVSARDFGRERQQNQVTKPGVDHSRADSAIASRAASRQDSDEQPATQPGRESYQDYKSSRAHSQASSRPETSNDVQGRTRREQPIRDRAPSVSQPQYRAPPPKITTDASEDQENMPPPTFRRNREHDFKYLGKSEKVTVLSDTKNRTVPDTPVPVPSHQSPRKALGALSENTPHRPAPPPPPKMTVLDAATKTAGASTTKSKKRRQHILVNGKLFTQMNKLGKGGSSDVYCVMAENYKLFALKKVKLEDCDETAVRGYKGEIDLLNKLVDVDRVVRLYDWELDETKQTLSVLMEKGDNDLNRILTMAQNTNDPRFDPILTRFYWKEMLECVAAVHEYSIVHSDLKPANFLMVQGKLKLIDFGIANAIDTDNTVNVHRDSHIGTPNYMSPESITDTNAPVPGADRAAAHAGRMMKLGKPSDVWSLGCILYQMTYGRPPFAHIANQISRIMAITNARVLVDFGPTGIGGAPVPAALRGTLRRCLQRDASLRPTVAQLLAPADAWLYPDAAGAVGMSEELLGQIIGKVVERCRDPKRGVPSVEEVAQYPASFMAKIREMVEREGVREVQG